MADEFILTDVFVEGAGVRRDARVSLEATTLECGGTSVPYAEVFWISRRRGMLLLFSGRSTVAVKGTSDQLDSLYNRLTDRVDLTELRRRIVRQLGHEVVLFTAGCAVSGQVDGEKVGGLHVAAVTRRAMYLLSGQRQLTVTWPARAASRRPARKVQAGDRDDDYLVVGKGNTTLTVRYLFPEELGAVLYAASQEPPPQSEATPLELFSRGEVSPPAPAELPPFSLAAGSLREVAERAAANVPGELQGRCAMPPYFFETHFQEIGEIALGPLLLRKSAAATAPSLARAVQAMNSAGLQEDTRAAVVTAVDRLVEVFSEQVERVAGGRGVTLRVDEGPSLVPGEREFLLERMQGPFDRLWERFGGLAGEEAELRRRISELDESPPDGDDREVREAADGWRAAMSRLDKGYEGAWREMVEEIEGAWSNDLLPRLARIGQGDRRRVPEWVQLAVLGFVTLVLAVVLVLLLVR